MLSTAIRVPSTITPAPSTFGSAFHTTDRYVPIPSAIELGMNTARRIHRTSDRKPTGFPRTLEMMA
jgi:hypothetical protein